MLNLREIAELKNILDNFPRVFLALESTRSAIYNTPYLLQFNFFPLSMGESDLEWVHFERKIFRLFSFIL